MNRTFFLLVLTIIISYVSYAEDNQVPAFVSSYVESLETIKPALLDIYELIDGNDIWQMEDNRAALLPTDASILLTHLENFNVSLKNAALRVQPYTESQDKSIQSAADRMSRLCQNLIKDTEASVSRLRSFTENTMNEKATDDFQKIVYEIDDHIGSFNYYLIHVSYAIADSIRRTYPDQDESRAYPPAERQEILKRLGTLFGAVDSDEKVHLFEGVHFCNAIYPLYKELKKEASDE